MPKVILVADIYDSFPELESEKKQEWESQKSINYLMETIQKLGYEVVLIEPKKSKIELLEKIKSILESSKSHESILFNLVEGFDSRNREAYIPSIAEFFGVAYTGSDSYAQNISLDKFLMKKIVSELHIPTKPSIVVEKKTRFPNTIHYPQFIKPNGEGSSLGIGEKNRIQNELELNIHLPKLLERFDSVLMEEYLDGEDLTLGVLGNYPNYSVTKVAKITYPSKVYDEQIKSKESMPEKLSFSIHPSLEKKIQDDSISICKRIKTLGYARLDWKTDKLGNPFFLEMNLTPGLSYFYSSLPICFYENMGNYSDLIKNILQFGYENYNTNKFFSYGKYEKI